MIKYRMSGFNEFDEIVILEILAINHSEALFTANLFDLSDILIEELEAFIYQS
tara:strand:- start:2775 stop:2933 length:159 start_codon:yes stop_codon:yes gene_type:complete